MNWLAEYFAQRTSPLTLSLWAHPPLVLGPDGPVAQPAYVLPYPGVQLALTPAHLVEAGNRRYELPAHYDAVQPLTMSAAGLPEGEPQFFREVTIYAPSRFNPDFLVTINGVFSFVPVFSSDGSPGFFGLSMDIAEESQPPSQMRLPWTFHGYISI
ncbi:hypothetical protein AYM40_35750 (plasmid) [Paraburkholderia phytofirmans OLGA172]|uniref:Uncharacterized protein n=1 Tax=Paraburkholderia phytofirmans OLGA172 TaxID=1417228 RepID=A0A160FXB1_9BURK|nr:hypothetical protein [Paraburkholderia phytofirmans]ANB77932.1 hypothetical protein AYM40_35750 [Paraburkholderia phytofirmans OLGA172]